MRHYALSVDPGMSNGVCLFSYGDDETEYFRQEALWQFGGGAPALADFLWTHLQVRENRKGHLTMAGAWVREPNPLVPRIHLEALVVEKFTPRGGAGFSLTQDSAEPLRGEGVIIGQGFLEYVDWAEPSQQYFMGSPTAPLAMKKRLSREFLKRYGLYVTGSMVGQKDADDAISAELHAISWLRRRRHMPTLIELFQPEEEE